jgi:uncharacterized protein GlcG (DUF336 family)
LETTKMKKTYLLRAGVMVTLAAAVLAMVPGKAQAQAAGPISKYIVSDDIAKRTLMKYVLNADTARAIVDGCIKWQKEQPGNVTVVVWVLSPTGQIIDSHAMDGVLPIGSETGLMKAKTALYARGTSASVADRFKDVDGRLIRLDLGREQGLSYYFVSGGIPIVVDNTLIGAVGVGGGNADERCAYEGLKAAMGIEPPPPAAPAGGGRGGAAGGGRGGRGQ